MTERDPRDDDRDASGPDGTGYGGGDDRGGDGRGARALYQLIADALREATELASKEFALFRAELAENISRLIAGIVMLIVAAIFGVATIVLLTSALVEWIAVLVGSDALAALIVAGVTLLLAIIFALIARNRLSLTTLEPKRTRENVNRDGDVFTNRGADEPAADRGDRGGCGALARAPRRDAPAHRAQALGLRHGR